MGRQNSGDPALSPPRIAHVLKAPFGTNEASGVSQVVHYLAHEQARIGQPVAVFSVGDGLYSIDGGTGPQRVGDDVLGWRPDLLHFHSVHVPQHIVLAARARRAGVRYCVTVHGGLFPAALRRSRLKKTLFALLFERRFLNNASFVHAVSPHEIEPIRRYGFAGPVIVVPNGVPPDGVAASPMDVASARCPPPRNTRTFVFIGRLDVWQKGLDLLIDAFAQAALPDAVLVLVGPDWRGSRRSLEGRAARLGITARVVFTGAVFGADRTRLFADADVFVHPSRCEGMSLSVMEATSAAKPCLLTREADPSGTLERANAAIVVQPTVPGIAEGLRTLGALRVSELEAMGARARQAVLAQPTWRDVASQLMDAYEKVCRMGRAPDAASDPP